MYIENEPVITKDEYALAVLSSGSSAKSNFWVCAKTQNKNEKKIVINKIAFFIVIHYKT